MHFKHLLPEFVFVVGLVCWIRLKYAANEANILLCGH